MVEGNSKVVERGVNSSADRIIEGVEQVRKKTLNVVDTALEQTKASRKKLKQIGDYLIDHPGQAAGIILVVGIVAGALMFRGGGSSK